MAGVCLYYLDVCTNVCVNLPVCAMCVYVYLYVCIIRVRPRKYCGGFATIVNSPSRLNSTIVPHSLCTVERQYTTRAVNHSDTELNTVLDNTDLKPCRVEVCERERWTMGTN